MAARGRGGSGDPDFGSDSFLDIVANLVGILIILIVLAGLRASQAPVQPDEVPDLVDTPSEVPSEVPGSSAPPVVMELSEDDRREQPVVPAEGVGVLTPEPVDGAAEDAPSDRADSAFTGMTADEAARQVAELESDVRRAQSRLDELNVEAAWESMRALQQRVAGHAARLRSLQEETQRVMLQAEQDTRRTEQAAAEAQQLRLRLEDVNQQLEELSQRDPQDDPLEIRINPIGRRSTGDELFFVVERHRVLRVPVRELFDLAAGRERNNAALMLRAETQRGVVGPVDGVTYEYEIGMQVRPVRSSSRGVSYTNSLMMHGVMHPGPAARWERVEDALAEGGILHRTLLQAAPGSVVRLSVATDSFVHARTIAAHCRDLGFLVSMNAMEPGEKIRVRFGAGSDAVAQ